MELKNNVIFFNGEKIMIDVFDDFFHIRKEKNSDKYLIQEQCEGDNNHACDLGHSLVSWKFIGIQDQIEAVFQCSTSQETFKVVYDYQDTKTYEEIRIKNPFDEN